MRAQEILDALVSNVNIELLNALHYHMINRRLTSEELRHGSSFSSMYQDLHVHVHHYSNGVTCARMHTLAHACARLQRRKCALLFRVQIVTVNCARLIKPDQHATNGIVHVVDRVITAVSNNVHTLIDMDEDLETLRVSAGSRGTVGSLGAPTGALSALPAPRLTDGDRRRRPDQPLGERGSVHRLRSDQRGL